MQFVIAFSDFVLGQLDIAPDPSPKGNIKYFFYLTNWSWIAAWVHYGIALYTNRDTYRDANVGNWTLPRKLDFFAFELAMAWGMLITMVFWVLIWDPVTGPGPWLRYYGESFSFLTNVFCPQLARL